eukprot:s66_g7.t1
MHSNQPKHQQSHQAQRWVQAQDDRHGKGNRRAQNDAQGYDRQWVQPPRKKSPRQRSGSNKQRTGKGRGQPLPPPPGKDPSETPAPGPPAVMPTYQEAPWLMAPPPPIPASSAANADPQSAAASAAEAKLKAMYSLLEKHQDGLPPEVQKEMQEAKMHEGEVAIKSLHKQVTALGKARTELQNANAARLNLHASWRAFLMEQVQKWQAYSQQYQQQETNLAERVNNARQALEIAKTNLATSKSKLGKDSAMTSPDLVTVSDEEDETRESKDAANASAKKITASLDQLGDSLKQLSSNADELMLAEEQAHKRQRTNSPSRKPSEEIERVADTYNFDVDLAVNVPAMFQSFLTSTWSGFHSFVDLCAEPLPEVAVVSWSCGFTNSCPGFSVSDVPGVGSHSAFSSLTAPFSSMRCKRSFAANPHLLTVDSSFVSKLSTGTFCPDDAHDFHSCTDEVSNFGSQSSFLTGVQLLNLAPSAHDASGPDISFINRFFATQCAYETDPSGPFVPSTTDATAQSSSDRSVHPLPDIPSFARDILAVSVTGSRASDLHALHGLWIRVWYIHLHVHVRSFMSRHCRLTGPPHLWRTQVEQLWEDVVIPNEASEIVLVSPTPPRNPFETELVHDLILYQGIDGRFVPGVVTMRPLDRSVGRSLYSGAVPFLSAVNRAAVIEGLALTQLCQERLCTVRQARTVYSATQFYQMNAGNAFEIDVGHPRSRAAGSSPIRQPATAPARPLGRGYRSAYPDHSDVLAHLTRLRDAGQLGGSVAHVDELDSCNASEDALSVYPMIQSTSPASCQVSLSCPKHSGDPLSLVAVSIPLAWCVHSSSSPLDTPLPFVSKLNDEKNSAAPGRTDDAPDPLQPVPIPAGIPMPLVLPQFVHEMFQDLPEIFIRGNLLQHGFLVRSWYLHHQHQLQSRLPRLLHVRGPPHTWKAQLLALWVDRLLPLAPPQVDLVKPHPPRDVSEENIAFDFIISQGMTDDSFSGLLLVDPPRTCPLIPRFFLAATLPARVSGRILIATLAFERTCQEYRCVITHRWIRIPVSHARVHNVLPGDFFLLVPHVLDNAVPAAGSTDSQDRIPLSSTRQDPEDPAFDSSLPIEDVSGGDASSSLDHDASASTRSRQAAADAFQDLRQTSLVPKVALPSPFSSDEVSVEGAFEIPIFGHGTDQVKHCVSFPNASHATRRPFPGSSLDFSSASRIVLTAGANDSDTAGTPSQRAPDGERGPPTANTVIQLPPAVQDLLTSLPDEFQIYPERIVQGFLVRTWFIHHITRPHSVLPRQIVLQGPPQHWRAQILALWQDWIVPGEDLSLDLVKPDPPRAWHEASVLFDLILSQGLYVGRFAGLVTLSPTVTEPTLRMFSIAVSFTSPVSGPQVVQLADVHSWCRRLDCLVFHRHVQLLLDGTVTHLMQHGDSFVVYASRRPEDPEPTSAALASVIGAASAGSMEVDPPVAGSSSSTAGAVAAPSGSVVPTGPQSVMRRVTRYRLDKSSLAAWIRWGSFSHLLQEVMAVLGLAHTDLLALHPLAVKPVGESEQETSFIVQHAHDVPLASSDQLALVDVIFHQQDPVSLQTTPTGFDRRVHRLPVPITREGIFQTCHVSNYCELRHVECLLSCNHALWPAQSTAPRDVFHGSYLRLHVPPLRTPGTETCRAVSLAETLGDLDDPSSFARAYPHLPRHDSPATTPAPPTAPPPAGLSDCLSTTSCALRSSRIAAEHVRAGPVFEVLIPSQAPPLVPNVPDWHQFEQELSSQFAELAEVELPEEGRVLHAITWFVHHDRAPVCLVGRLVRLSHRPHDWLLLLCAPWLHMLQPFENLAFHLVRPGPTSDFPGQTIVHVILEQGLQQSRMTALFSALFQGLHHDIKHHRRAQSIPTSLSLETIVRILDLRDLCAARRCTAWSGGTQFRRSQLDRVYNGIGVCLTVDAHRNRYGPVDEDGFSLPHTAASSSSQPVPRVSFRPDDASLFPSSPAADQEDLASEHQPGRLIPELRVIWEQYLMSTTSRPYRFLVETWFCDHDRFPKNDASRVIVLPPHQELWRQVLVDTWQDLIDPSVDVFLYVVTPPPFGGPGDVLAHIIVAQHQHRGFVSALITTVAPGDDPWEPPRCVLKLPSVVDKGLLIQESGIMTFCPPFIPFNQCRAFHGDVGLEYGMVLPTSSGMSFLCEVDSRAGDAALLVAPPEYVDKLRDHNLHLMRSVVQILVHLNDLVHQTSLDHASTIQLDSLEGIASSSAPPLSVKDFSVLDDAALASHLHSALLTPAPVVDPTCEPSDSRCAVSVGSSSAPSVSVDSLPANDSPHRSVAAVPSPGATGLGATRHPVTLGLEAALPVPSSASGPVPDCAEVPFSTEPSWITCLESTSFQLAPLPDGMHVHTETAHALAHPRAYRCPANADCIELYIDGSTAPGIAAWSLVVVRYDGRGIPSFCGCCAAPVDICPASSAWIGAEWADNISAELSAVVVAQVLALSLTPCSAFVIRPDLQLSVMLSTDQCRCKVHSKLAQLVQWLGAEFQRQGGLFCEVRSHQGNPWNELADRLALFSASQHSRVGAFDLRVCHELVSTNSIAWAWTQLQPLSFRSCLPPSADGITWQIHPSGRRLSSPALAASHSDQHAQLAIRIVSANVLALDGPSDPGVATSGDRVLRLARQWHGRQCHAIGIQESRRPPGRHINEHYITFASGADTAHPTPMFGCELWLHRTLPWILLDDGSVLTINDAKLVVAHADPRRLIVTAAFASVSLSFVVLHVPCRTAARESLDHLQAWWEETKQILRQVSLAPFYWVCVDSNAPLASAAFEGLGLFGAEVMNPAGTLFEDACQELSWCAPCTFEWCHTGPHSTWTHPKGTHHRRDYVLTSEAAFPFACASCVQTQHDGGFAHEDHLPTELSVRGWFRISGCIHRPKWDQDAFRDPVKKAQFRQALHSLPIPAWDVNVDDHARLFEQQVLQLAQQIFAPQQKAKSKPRLTEATVNLIAWKRSVLDFGRTHGHMQCPDFRYELRQLEHLVRAAVRRDQMQYYASLIDDLADAGDLSNFKAVYRTLRRIGGRTAKTPGVARALPLLRDHSGAVVTTFAQQQLLWMSQFGKVEAGQPLSWDSLRSLHGPGLGLDPTILNPDVLPTVADFLSTISKLKGGKAPGPNCLPPEICKIGSAMFAQHMAPLTLKAACHGKEPLSWRGGNLVALHKGKLPTWDPSGYRSIFVSDHTAKLYHSALRQHLVRTWESNLEHLQVGGRVGLGTDFAHHAVQAHWAHSVIRHQPAAVIFFDFQAAFYSVIRQGLFPEELDAQGLRSAMLRLGATVEEIDELLAFAHQDAALNGIDAHAAALLQDLFRNTFFTVEGVPFPCLTSKGTRPGDPVGDILFNMSMRLILKDVTEFVRQHTEAVWEGSPIPHHDFTHVGSPASHAWWELAFVDDCAISVRAASNEQLLELVQLATAGMVRSARKRGLVVNFESGKSEVLLNLAGAGTRAVKETLAANGSKLDVVVAQRTYQLQSVFAYRHLGTWIQQSGKQQRDVRFRLSLAKQAWGPLLKPFFTKPQISLRTKVRVLSSLVMSRYCYNVHTWCMPDDGALKEWHGALRPLLYPLARRFLRGLPPFQFGINVLCGLLSMLPPEDQLHLNRLRYLPRLLKSCTPALWNLLCAVRSDSRSWLSRCQESFAWFAKFYGPRLGLSEHSELHDWITMAKLDPAWKGKLRKATNSCVQFRLAQAEAEVWQAWISQDLEQHGGFPVVRPSIDQRACWHCDLCDATFATSKQLAVHSVRTHGYRSIMKHFARDGRCAHCAREFHTRTRLCAHFHSKPDCLRHHQACFLPLTPDELQELDAQERQQTRVLKQQGWLPTKAILPAIRAYGPALPPVDSPAAQAMLDFWTRQAEAEPAHAFQMLAGHCEGILTDEASVPPQDDVIPGFLYQSPQGTRKGYANCFEMGGLARLAASLHITTYCFVHFFSGYRREGDLQYHIDHHWIQGTVQIFCLSVDFCIQRAGGDLSTPASREWWKSRILSGAIVGVGGGPPCESYSAARHLPDGPVPLRSEEYIDGLPYNTARGWVQTLLGSRLMRFLIEMLLACAQVGACGFLEHPAYPLWIQALSPASVWLTQELKWLRRLHCCSVLTIDQCVLGCEGRKPTTLFLVRMPGLITRLRKYGHQGRCHHRPGFHAGLAGKDSAGAFKTSVAKIYPSLLNQEIAAEIVSFVTQLSRGSFLTSPLPEEFLPFRCLDFVDHQVVQNDFHGEVMVEL